MKNKQSKRILSVNLLRTLDKDPDTSYLQQKAESGELMFAERWQQFQSGRFGFIGIVAEAEIGIPSESKRFSGAFTIQTVTSGGVWGIESDSDREYIESIEKEQLSELRGQLKALGFSSRAISRAFQDAQRKDS